MKGLLTFSQSQKTGLYLFGAVIALVILTLLLWPKPSTEQEQMLQAEQLMQEFDLPELALDSTQLLDINLATADQWGRLPGVPPVVANRIVAYRDAIGGFRNIDDLARVYGLTQTVLDNNRSFLFVNPLTAPNRSSSLGRDRWQAPPTYQGPTLDINTATPEQLEKLPGIGTVLSQRIVNYRALLGGYTSLDQLEQVYQLPVEVLDQIREYLVLGPVPDPEEAASYAAAAMDTSTGSQEQALLMATKANAETYIRGDAPELASINVNLADSATLVTIPGIGPTLAPRIIRYRKALGYMTSVDMLRSVYGLSEENYQRMAPYLQVGDLDSYPKRDLNVIGVRGLAFYPFIDQELAESVLQQRRQLGRFDRWEEVAAVPGMSEEALTGLKAYFTLDQMP